jgi:hypothetical protein
MTPAKRRLSRGLGLSVPGRQGVGAQLRAPLTACLHKELAPRVFQRAAVQPGVQRGQQRAARRRKHAQQHCRQDAACSGSQLRA